VLGIRRDSSPEDHSHSVVAVTGITQSSESAALGRQLPVFRSLYGQIKRKSAQSSQLNARPRTCVLVEGTIFDGVLNVREAEHQK
jgi:hypothetical protein